jgi:hypothetical protein
VLAVPSITITVFNHVISKDTNVFAYLPSVQNMQTSYCSLKYYLQENVSGAWSDYSGPLATLDSSLQKLTLTSTSSDMALDGFTKHFRVGISSTTPLSLAAMPLLLDVYVKYVGPCYSAVFSDIGALSPLINTVMSNPHPQPFI